MNLSERIEKMIRSSFDLSEYGSDYHNSNHLKVFHLLLIKNTSVMDRGASSSSDSSGAALVPCKARYVPGIKGKNPTAGSTGIRHALYQDGWGQEVF